MQKAVKGKRSDSDDDVELAPAELGFAGQPQDAFAALKAKMDQAQGKKQKKKDKKDKAYPSPAPAARAVAPAARAVVPAAPVHAQPAVNSSSAHSEETELSPEEMGFAGLSQDAFAARKANMPAAQGSPKKGVNRDTAYPTSALGSDAASSTSQGLELAPHETGFAGLSQDAFAARKANMVAAQGSPKKQAGKTDRTYVIPAAPHSAFDNTPAQVQAPNAAAGNASALGRSITEGDDVELAPEEVGFANLSHDTYAARKANMGAAQSSPRKGAKRDTAYTVPIPTKRPVTPDATSDATAQQCEAIESDEAELSPHETGFAGLSQDAFAARKANMAVVQGSPRKAVKRDTAYPASAPDTDAASATGQGLELSPHETGFAGLSEDAFAARKANMAAAQSRKSSDKRDSATPSQARGGKAAAAFHAGVMHCKVHTTSTQVCICRQCSCSLACRYDAKQSDCI